MKGYLQRVIASAVKAVPAINPVLGPVYAASRFEAEPPVPGAWWTESQVETERAAESAISARSVEARYPEAPIFPEDSPAPREVRERQDSRDRFGFAPLIEAPLAATQSETKPVPDSMPRIAASGSASQNELPERSAFEPPVRAPETAVASYPLPENPPPQFEPNPVPLTHKAPNVPPGIAARRNELRERSAFEPPVRATEAAAASYPLPENPRPQFEPNPVPLTHGAPNVPPGVAASGSARQNELTERFAFEPLIRVPETAAENYRLPEYPPPQDVEPNPAPLTQPQTRRAESGLRSSVPYGDVSQERKGRRESGVRSQPDEVQIHIGRIEVVAVQPAAPPAIRKPVRKSLSLGEYLKRGR